MSDVLVRNIDEVVIEQLKAGARGNRRSSQAELKLILEQAAQPAPTRPSRAGYRGLADQILRRDRTTPTGRQRRRCWPRTGSGECRARSPYRPASEP